MNIIHISNFHYLLGGGSRYFFDVSKLLVNHNNHIAHFSTQNSQNKFSPYSKYFVSDMPFDHVSLRNGMRILGRMLYSVETRRNIRRLFIKFTPDVVHLHDIYHRLSPSLLFELRKRIIPVVQTVHDYHLIAPNYNLFHNGSICEITLQNKFYKALFHKCVKNSYLASLAEVIEKYVHYLLGWERNYVDFFIAPSKFIRNKLIEYGFLEKKIIYLCHFVPYSTYTPDYKKGNYVLYFGRLSPEKGLDNLIDTFIRLPKIPLYIVGRGTQEYETKLKSFALKASNIKFLGYYDGFKLRQLITNSCFSVLPSIWYEVAAISLLESFAAGKPVVASRIGGIPETVKNGYNGLLFDPGNIKDLAEKIGELWSNPALCRRLGRHAREDVMKRFGPEEHYEALMGIYKKAIALHR